MKGVYELRKFVEINGEKLLFSQKQSFVDIYLHRKGHTKIGIKFREPKTKQYGWKLSNFECKIAEEQKFPQGLQIHSWKKYRFQLQKKIKLKIKKIEELNKQQKQQKQQKYQKQQYDQFSDDNNDQISLPKLIKKAKKIHQQVSKVLLKSNIKNNNKVIQWCKNDDLTETDLQLFALSKDKQKSMGVQIGKIKVQNLMHNKQIKYYETNCLEGQNPQPLLLKLKEWKNVNFSYPQLLQKLACHKLLEEQTHK